MATSVAPSPDCDHWPNTLAMAGVIRRSLDDVLDPPFRVPIFPDLRCAMISEMSSLATAEAR